MLNLIFGIILNTFNTIRDKKFENKFDQISKCFICDIEKVSLDKKGSGFDFHVKNEHNMWDYIFYILSLDKKGNLIIFFCMIFFLKIFFKNKNNRGN